VIADIKVTDPEQYKQYMALSPGAIEAAGGRFLVRGGQREFVPVLARAAIAAGVSGLFMETHPDPARALSDGPNAWPLARMAELLSTLKALDEVVKRDGFAEQSIHE